MFSIMSPVIKELLRRSKLIKISYTVVGDNINIMKTTFKQHGYTKIWKQRKAVNLKSFTLITCKLVIRKKLINN